MYNGIGLQTARGTGTNGYVQRNLSHVRKHKETVEYKPDEEIKKLEAYISKKGNAELLKHDRKRKIEVKCLEMEEMMAEQGYSEEDITKKVEKFRKQLLEKDSQKDESDMGLEYDQFGKPSENGTHKLAEANDMKNRKLREAFGLGEFDPSLRAKQEEEERRLRAEREKELRQKRYQWVDQDDVQDDLGDNYSRSIQNRRSARERDASPEVMAKKTAIEELNTDAKSSGKKKTKEAKIDKRKDKKSTKSKNKKKKKPETSSSSSSSSSSDSDSSSSSSSTSNSSSSSTSSSGSSSSSSSSSSDDEKSKKTKKKSKKEDIKAKLQELNKRKHEQINRDDVKSSDEENEPERKKSTKAFVGRNEEIARAYDPRNQDRDRGRDQERERERDRVGQNQERDRRPPQERNRDQESLRDKRDRSRDRNYSRNREETKRRDDSPVSNRKNANKSSVDVAEKRDDRARKASRSPPVADQRRAGKQIETLKQSSRVEVDSKPTSREDKPARSERDEKKAEKPVENKKIVVNQRKSSKSRSPSKSRSRSNSSSMSSYFSSSEDDMPPRRLMSKVVKK